MEIIKGKHYSSNPEIQKAKDFFFESYEKNSKINVKATAESLGVTRQTLHKWINQING